MSYTKTTWQDGDIITTEKLNKIENGIEQVSSGSGGARIINLSELEYSEEVNPNNTDITKCIYSGYDAGLYAEDFINSWMVTAFDSDHGRTLGPVLRVQDDYNHPETGGTIVTIEAYSGESYFYNPETGEFFYYREKEK